MEQTPLIAVGLPIALFIIMIGMGLTLTPAEFQHEAKRPRSLPRWYYLKPRRLYGAR